MAKIAGAIVRLRQPRECRRLAIIVSLSRHYAATPRIRSHGIEEASRHIGQVRHLAASGLHL